MCMSRSPPGATITCYASDYFVIVQNQLHGINQNSIWTAGLGLGMEEQHPLINRIRWMESWWGIMPDSELLCSPGGVSCHRGTSPDSYPNNINLLSWMETIQKLSWKSVLVASYHFINITWWFDGSWECENNGWVSLGCRLKPRVSRLNIEASLHPCLLPWVRFHAVV